MAGTSRNANTKRKLGVTRCLAIKNNGSICGTILNRYHEDNICFACRHRVAWNLENPKFAELKDYKKQKGADNAG